MAVVAVIQARMGSTRLPGKVMKDLTGMPVLWHVITRVKFASLLDHIVVATTTLSEDDRIEQACRQWGIRCFRGEEEDVLSRYYNAVDSLEQALEIRSDYVVRVTADCPLIDPMIINKLVLCAQEGQYDYVSNTDPPTFPDGLDVEVMTKDALESAYKNARLLSDREHVTPFIRQNSIFRKYNFKNSIDLSHMRWTLDTPEDYTFIKRIYNTLYREKTIISMDQVLQLLRQHPELLSLNDNSQRNEGYVKSLQEDRVYSR